MELLFGSELNPLVGTRNPGYEVKYVLCAWILEEKGDWASISGCSCVALFYRLQFKKEKVILKKKYLKWC